MSGIYFRNRGCRLLRYKWKSVYKKEKETAKGIKKLHKIGFKTKWETNIKNEF